MDKLYCRYCKIGFSSEQGAYAHLAEHKPLFANLWARISDLQQQLIVANKELTHLEYSDEELRVYQIEEFEKAKDA